MVVAVNVSVTIDYSAVYVKHKLGAWNDEIHIVCVISVDVRTK